MKCYLRLSSPSLFFAVAVLALWLNFSGHILSTLPLKHFLDGEFPSERYVFSRLVYNLDHGTDAEGGFMLYYEATNPLYQSVHKSNYAQFKYDLQSGNTQTSMTYVSHYGLQDNLVFPLWQGLEWVKAYLLEKIAPDSHWHNRLKMLDWYYYNMISQGLVALLNAAAIGLFLLWGARNFSVRQGWISLALVLVMLPALTFFGRSLWWMMWSWYLPMLITLWGLHFIGGRKPGWAFSVVLGVLAGAAICLKALMGYEYLAPVMVAAMVPPVFYAVWKNWGWMNWFLVSCVMGALCLAGALAAIYLHIQALEDYGQNPWSTLMSLYEMRAYGSAQMETETSAIALSTRVPLWEVLGSYLIYPKAIAIPQILLMLPFLVLLYRGRRDLKTWDSLSRAFTAAIGVSFLGGLSMLVVLKGHAYIHAFDVVTWCIPMNLFLLGFYAAMKCGAGACDTVAPIGMGARSASS